MKRRVFLLFILCVFFDAASSVATQAAEDWVFMPAGAKSSYMGIHGGTMPVSLLVSDDGESLLTFVGRTGNDFLEALRGLRLRLPSFANATAASPSLAGMQTGLFAGNATSTLPVFIISGDTLVDLGQELEPFGLSRERLSIEGRVVRPESFPHAHTVRSFFLPDYFQPRRIHSAQ